MLERLSWDSVRPCPRHLGHGVECQHCNYCNRTGLVKIRRTAGRVGGDLFPDSSKQEAPPPPMFGPDDRGATHH